jgi:hypothetical protein
MNNRNLKYTHLENTTGHQWLTPENVPTQEAEIRIAG